MENATKALLIAGSVLIAILLIAMGVRLFSSTTGTVDSAEKTMDATAITTFNSQFAGYLGENISASKVRTLQQKVIASNAVNQSHQVGGTILSFNEISGMFGVTVTEYDKGYIKTISVTAKP